VRILRWGRSDQVGLEAVLWLVPVLGVGSLLAGVIDLWRDGPIRVQTELPDGLVEAGAGLQGPYEGTVVLANPSTSQHVVHLLPHLVAVLLAVTVAALLLGAVRDLGAGDPFTPSSAQRLQALAAVVAVGGVLVQVVDDLARNQVVAQVPGLGNLPVTFELSFWPLAAGLVIAFLGEVFARGVALLEDVEGLV